jgi:hypothetical protein
VWVQQKVVKISAEGVEQYGCRLDRAGGHNWLSRRKHEKSNFQWKTQRKAIFMENTAIQREKRRNIFKIEQCIHSVFGY